MAKKLLSEFNHKLSDVANQSVRTLRVEGGLDIRNAALTLASLELGRRSANIQSDQVEAIHNNQDIYNIFAPMLSKLPYEEFWVAYLNASNCIISKDKVSQGGVNGTMVDHKIIIKRAVELLACGLVIVHNHPSGNTTPSKEDITLTHKLVTGASLFEISVIDHVIITPTQNVSLRLLGII